MLGKQGQHRLRPRPLPAALLLSHKRRRCPWPLMASAAASNPRRRNVIRLVLLTGVFDFQRALCEFRLCPRSPAGLRSPALQPTLVICGGLLLS